MTLWSSFNSQAEPLSAFVRRVWVPYGEADEKAFVVGEIEKLEEAVSELCATVRTTDVCEARSPEDGLPCWLPPGHPGAHEALRGRFALSSWA